VFEAGKPIAQVARIWGSARAPWAAGRKPTGAGAGMEPWALSEDDRAEPAPLRKENAERATAREVLQRNVASG